MTQCPQCGAPTYAGQSFCGTCGTNLATAGTAPGRSSAERTVVRPVPADPTLQFPVGLPRHAGPAYAAPSTRPTIDLAPLLGANWLGTVLVGVAMFGVALVLSIVFTGLVLADDFKVKELFWGSLIGVGNTFGADTVVTGDDAVVTSGRFPSLVTLAALAVGVLLLRRTSPATTTVRQGLGDAARAALVLMLLLLGLALVLRIVTPELRGFLFGESETHLSFAGVILQGFLLPFVVLASSVLLRRDLLTGRAAEVRDWVSAPVAGLGALLAGLLVAGLVFLLAEVVGNESARELSTIASGLAALPSLGLWLVGLGVGAELGGWSRSDGETDESVARLASHADDAGALFWVAPLVALALAALAVWVVVLRTRDRSLVTRNVGVYVGSLLVVLPLAVRMANVHHHTRFGDLSTRSVQGIAGFQTVTLFFLVSAVAAAAVLVVTGNLDVSRLQSQAASLARKAQSAAPGQPPAPHAPPPGPPPGWPSGPPPSGPPASGAPASGPAPAGPPPSGPPPGWPSRPPS